jgi:phosphatidylserine synthase
MLFSFPHIVLLGLVLEWLGSCLSLYITLIAFSEILLIHNIRMVQLKRRGSITILSVAMLSFILDLLFVIPRSLIYPRGLHLHFYLPFSFEEASFNDRGIVRALAHFIVRASPAALF